ICSFIASLFHWQAAERHLLCRLIKNARMSRSRGHPKPGTHPKGGDSAHRADKFRGVGHT
ncbi:MAG: hypothetical protein V1758_13565, partial [Pseudomonadota bacterium]